jgi:voltage-gated potassium channel
VDALRDYVIICGYGRIGTRVLGELEREGVPHIAIDNNPDAVARLRAEGRLYLEGDAASEEILHQAQIERARGLVCAVDSDERAVYITLAARALRRDLYIIARAGHPESLRRLELAGANRVISPYRMAGHRMAEMALHPAIVEVMDSLQESGGEIGVEEMVVPSECCGAGQTLQAAGLLAPGAARLLALRRADGTLDVNPGPTQHLQAGDLLIVLGSSQEIDRTAALLQ